MTYQDSRNLEFPAIAALMEKIALYLPAAVIAYPILIWPIVYPSTVDELNGLVAPSTEVPEYLLNKIYFPILFVVAAFGLMVSRRHLPRQFCTFGCAMFAILTFFALSSLWSLSPNTTIRRTLLEVMVCGTILMSTLSIPNPQKVIVPVIWLLVVAMFINLVPVLVQPAGKIGHPGIYNHKNALGQTSCLAFLVFLYGVAMPGSPRLRTACILAIVVSLFTLFQSRSKTAQGLAVLSPIIGLYLYFLCRTCKVPLLYAMAGSIGAFICGYLLFSELTGIQSGDIFLWLFNDETFSGRTIIWQYAWERIQERPWLGFGFEGFWDIGPSSPKFKTQNFIARMPHAHNGYLEVMLETGAIGFTLFFFFLLVVIRLVGRMTKVDGRMFYFFVTLLPYILINEMMEHDIFSPMPPNWNFLVLIGAVSCALNSATLRPRLRLN